MGDYTHGKLTVRSWAPSSCKSGSNSIFLGLEPPKKPIHFRPCLGVIAPFLTRRDLPCRYQKRRVWKKISPASEVGVILRINFVKFRWCIPIFSQIPRCLQKRRSWVNGIHVAPDTFKPSPRQIVINAMLPQKSHSSVGKMDDHCPLGKIHGRK